MFICKFVFGYIKNSSETISTVAAVESVAIDEVGNITFPLLITLCVALALAVLIIIGLVHWGRRQDHLEEMMLFCMKFLLKSQDNTERCASAKALTEAKDPGALLVLADLVSDEDETEGCSLGGHRCVTRNG